MKKIRTARDLIDALDRELGWRRKELINIKLLHDKARDPLASRKKVRFKPNRISVQLDFATS